MKLFWLENDYKDDRRLYNRLKVDIPIIIYIEGKELDGALKDISENGVKISISDIQDIKKGDFISFIYVDTIDCLALSYNIKASARVIRTNKTIDGYDIGCSICVRDSWSEYVSQKKVEQYLKVTCPIVLSATQRTHSNYDLQNIVF